MNFVISGPAMPYVRMTHKGKWINERAQSYLASQEAIRLQFKMQMSDNNWEMLPKRSLSVSIEFVVTCGLHKCDLSNLGKAIEDAAQGIVFKNDCWVDRIRLSRRLGQEDKILVMIN